ncbi:hypothetical protein ABID81_000181 [Frigoribacterium sp. PvP054]|uniref:aggregation-promoting factor C-terminal-like domain-containing protein n=1 Tax=Frigoribacterium sp. PvP054 TaxID=3156438 RepID=UPI00339A7BE4
MVRRPVPGAVAFTGPGRGSTAAPRRAGAPRRLVLPLIGFCASFAFVSASLVNPLAGAEAATSAPGAAAVLTAPGQTLTVADAAVTVADRDAYGVTEYVPPPPPVVVEETAAPATTSGSSSGTAKKSSAAPVAGTPDPGSAKAIAAEIVASRGWGSDQYDCLVSLWQKESSWNVYASNRSSGAYGIPQALPGSKMASVGADWQTNPATQITWGLNYIGGRYGTPCGAWGHSVANNWY